MKGSGTVYKEINGEGGKALCRFFMEKAMDKHGSGGLCLREVGREKR